MRALLSPQNAKILSQLAWSNALIAFDYDGTLAPIVRARDDASLRPSTTRLFEQVCDLYPTAVISGRARDDVAARLGAAKVRYVVGNHGLEPSAGLRTFERQARSIRASLEVALAGCEGVELEDKRYSLALHYRKSRRKRDARDAIRASVAALPMRVRTVLGKLVVNVVPEGAPNKGHALLALRASAGADVALYVGDDVTDEDVFQLDQPGRLFTVRVGEAASSSATFFLRDQRQIDRLLARLVALRVGPPRHDEP